MARGFWNPIAILRLNMHGPPLMELPEPGFELRPWIPEDGMEGHTDQEEEE